MHIVRGGATVHINYTKTTRAIVLAPEDLSAAAASKIDFCEIFGVFRFLTFSTASVIRVVSAMSAVSPLYPANRRRQLADPVRKVPTVVGQVFTSPRLTASSGALDDEHPGALLRSKSNSISWSNSGTPG
jgi:hypothetical protein